jgi:DNA replication and repair protein RecF
LFVKHVTLANFRNHNYSEVEFRPGVSVIAGENGHGKTNLVEAIHYLATLSSHRTAGYIPLIGKTAETAVVKLKVSHNLREAVVSVELSRNAKNQVSINGTKSPRNRDVLGYVQTVTFAPEDLDMVKKEPGFRRAFIDGLLIQLTPRLAGVFADYDRVLKQRNTLLKSAKQNRVSGSALATLDAWDEQLVNLGAQILVARRDLVDRLNPKLAEAYSQIAATNNKVEIQVKSSLLSSTVPGFEEEEDLEGLEFLPQVTSDEAIQLFRTRLIEVRPKEIERGLTLCGPQRDDLILLLNDMPAKHYASHGESWSYALALRLASRELLREDSNYGDPVLILDDVFAELDLGRRTRLAELVSNNEQVLITSAELNDVPELLRTNVYQVRRGQVTSLGFGGEASIDE